MTISALPVGTAFTQGQARSATLIGLVFIVITLGAQIAKDGVEAGVYAFVTPCCRGAWCEG
jgi:hypothetical protein